MVIKIYAQIVNCLCHLTDSGGTRDAPPSRSNLDLFHFQTIFEKKRPNNMLAPTLGVGYPPHLENPGPATERRLKFSMFAEENLLSKIVTGYCSLCRKFYTINLSIFNHTRDVIFTIETGHSADFCCQALLQLKASVTLSRSHCTRHLHTKIMLSRDIKKLLNISVLVQLKYSWMQETSLWNKSNNLFLIQMSIS